MKVTRRQPPGTPVGGQFADQERGRSLDTVTGPPLPEAVRARLEASTRAWVAREVARIEWLLAEERLREAQATRWPRRAAAVKAAQAGLDTARSQMAEAAEVAGAHDGVRHQLWREGVCQGCPGTASCPRCGGHGSPRLVTARVDLMLASARLASVQRLVRDERGEPNRRVMFDALVDGCRLAHAKAREAFDDVA